jgi:hypothetical protein
MAIRFDSSNMQVTDYISPSVTCEKRLYQAPWVFSGYSSFLLQQQCTLNAHFHSRKISMDRKFSENIIVKS